MRIVVGSNRSGRYVGIVCAFCSWMRPSKRYSGRLRNMRSVWWSTAMPASSLARVVRLDEVEALAPRAARRSSRSRAASSRSSCSSASRYMIQSPVAASSETLRASENEPFHGKCDAPSRRTTRRSRRVRSVEPVSTMIISSTTSRSGLEAAREHLLLVLDDHREADAQALGRLGVGDDRVDAAHQRRQRERDLRRQRRGHVDVLAPAAGQLVEVAAHVRQVGVEPLGGLEQAAPRASAGRSRRRARPRS